MLSQLGKYPGSEFRLWVLVQGPRKSEASGQAIFEHRPTFPNAWQIYFQMASFGYIFAQIWIRQFSNTDTRSKAIADLLQNYIIWILFCPDLDQATFMLKFCPFGTILFVPVDTSSQPPHFQSNETRFGLRFPTFRIFEHVGHAFGSAGVEREHS